jgi:2-oxoglutarate ferredoxin oxidoreductase subunit beta
MADFLRVYGFHALHGRTVPIAEGIKLANHGLKVLVVGGDGGLYGEGMGHFIASVRGNHNITMLVHDNQVYGLTTGQAAPTATKGAKSKSTPQGVIEVPVNPMGLALAANGTWVARSYAGDIQYTKNLLKQAIMHPGFALLDVFQPCITFNKVNTHAWFQERVYKLDQAGHDPSDKTAAMMRAQETEKLPIGLFYADAEAPAYHQQIPNLAEKPLTEQFATSVDLSEILQKMS